MGTVKITKPTSDLMDAFRGGSALIVVAVHAFQIFIIPYCGFGSYPHLLTSLIATYAISIFFIVSGFMICISVLRHRKDGAFNSIGFAEARILRIYPPLTVAILITIAVYLVISNFGLHGAESYRLGGELSVVRESVKLEWAAIPSTFFLLYGAVPDALPPLNMDGPLWTLGYEWWFYILAFLTARLSNGFNWRTVLPLALVAAMLIYGRNWLFYRFFAIWLSGFGLGYFYANGVLLKAKSRWLLAAIAALIVTAIAIGRDETLTLILNPFDTRDAQNLIVLSGGILTLLIALAVRSDIKLRYAGVLVSTAAFSYTLYVIHYPLLLLSYSFLHPLTHGHSWIIAALAALGSVILIAMISSLFARLTENRKLFRRGIINSSDNSTLPTLAPNR
jgi:peptidoglycan/LPS O-acetylase OafA/YrhL